ncbi:cell division protein ZapA [Pontibacillus halophilus JSM 076056 = DSM 19796]|uniref:Cell division protein ZapA n=1 Tax=Pontibacillus halophilus JSM 076056 = DSM 19796 TaxID=1385510 RepID=A0A0A5GN61_9BACI|nr:cell division protein ZapA [Pontibacillus halophilus]KGX93419.1 cell division protein ZapA [Pontibacillus halophilus JSM 076056 = DSM 19796]
MSQSKKRTTVDIHNRSYTIVGEEAPHHIRMVASLVDQQMRDIHANNPQLDTAKLAVLTAVNAMNDYVKLKEEYTNLLQQLEKEEDKTEND